MNPKVYAKVFMETVYKAPEKKQDKMLSRFLDVVRKNGDSPLIKKIFRNIQEAVIMTKGDRMVALELARDVSPELRAKIKTCFSEKDNVEQITRPELLAGARILIDGELELDMSLLRKLKKIFQAS